LARRGRKVAAGEWRCASYSAQAAMWPLVAWEWLMAKNEKSSKELASLAGKVLKQKSSTEAAKKLAGSVLTQAPDNSKKRAAAGKKKKQ
jgi:hypothetical protein